MAKYNILDPKTGKMKVVEYIRRWDKAGGYSVCLTEEGDYIYPNGNLVKNKDDLTQSIPIGPELDLAYAWFEENWGEGETAKERKDKENKELDAIKYMRRKGKYRPSSPKTWIEFEFPVRPNWWGVQDNVVIKEGGVTSTYIRYYPEKEEKK